MALFAGPCALCVTCSLGIVELGAKLRVTGASRGNCRFTYNSSVGKWMGKEANGACSLGVEGFEWLMVR